MRADQRSFGTCGERQPSEGEKNRTPHRDIQHPAAPAEPARHIHLHAFRATPFAVRDALHTARTSIKRLLHVEDAWAMELVLAEIMNNIVEHGYGETTEDGTILLALSLQGGELVCTVGDFGPEIPPASLSGESPRPEATDLPEGGFGWFLIRNLAQDLQYDRVEGHNRLTMRFPLANRA